MVATTFATATDEIVVTERPGETGWTLEGVTTEGRDCGLLTATGAIGDLLMERLAIMPAVVVILSLDRRRIDFVVLEGVGGAPFVLADGEGRFYDIDSRRPVNRRGDRISLANAEHDARNHARSTARKAA